MIVFNKSEFIIRRYVLAHEKLVPRKIQFFIGKGGNELASGSVIEGDLRILSTEIKKAKSAICFPTPEEILANEKIEAAKIEKLKLEIKSKRKTKIIYNDIFSQILDEASKLPSKTTCKVSTK